MATTTGEGIRRLAGVAWSRVDQMAGRVPLWPTLAVVSLATLLVQLPGPHATAWHYFHDAGDLLVGDGPASQAGGLHVYRDRPDFQFGPLSIVAAVPLSGFGVSGSAWPAMVLGSIVGLLALALILDAARFLRPDRPDIPAGALLVGGVTFVVTWGDVAVRTTHIDDAIVLVALAAAVRWCAQARPWLATVALAVAAAAKPWAVMFAPLALLPLALAPEGVAATPLRSRAPARWARANRRGIGRVASVGVLAAVTWAPFMLAERRTWDARSFGIVNDPTSVLRAMGVTDPTTPGWARPAQLVGGMVLVALLVVARRWPAAILGGVAWRLLLEPGAHRYYTIGLVMGALLVELVYRRDRLPWMTAAAAVVLELTAAPDFAAVPGRYARLICVVLALAAAWVASIRLLEPPGDAVSTRSPAAGVAPMSRS